MRINGRMTMTTHLARIRSIIIVALTILMSRRTIRRSHSNSARTARLTQPRA